MADNQLTATSGSGEQATTQSPQSVPVANGLGGPAATNIQSGAASSLQGSTQLTNLSSTSIKLNVPQASSGAQASTKAVVPAFTPQHHFNPALLSVPVLLVLLAGAMFWFTSHTAKNTTNY